MKRKPVRPHSNQRTFNRLTKAFIWVVLVIFVLTSVGVVLAIR